MIRSNIQCVCGSNDFTIEESIVPEGMSFVCETCGRVTPIAVKQCLTSDVYPINNENMHNLYEKSYCNNITKEEIRKAFCK